MDETMKLKIECRTHGNAKVIPAGDALHWIPEAEQEWFELDEGDLYCTGGGTFHPDHEFFVTIIELGRPTVITGRVE
jgi:hypothetical protein